MSKKKLSAKGAEGRTGHNKPGRLAHWLIWSNVASPFLAFLYLFLFFWIIIAAGDAAERGANDTLFFLSLTAAAFSYFACRRIALPIFIFGAELGGPPYYRLRRLWKLAARYYALPGFIVLIAAPVITGIGTRWFSVTPAQSSWILPVSLLLLHWLFAATAIYHYIAVEPQPVQWTLWVLLFPFRIFSLVFEHPYVLLLFIPLGWVISWMEVEPGQIIHILNTSTTAALEVLLALDGVGPALLYLLNPVYLILALYTGAGVTSTAVYAFPGVTLLLLIIITLRLRQLVFIDWPRNHANSYEEWLLNRHLVADELFGAIPLAGNGPSALDYEEHEDYAPQPRQLITHTKTGPKRIQAENLALPAESPHEFIARITVPPAPLLNKAEVAVLAISLMAILAFGEAMWIALLGLWLLITCAYALPAQKHTWITPQPAWPTLRLLLVKKIIPYWPGDAGISLLLILLTQGNWYAGLAVVTLLVSFRLAFLGAKLSYAMQSKVFYVAVFSLIIHIINGNLSVVYIINPEKGGAPVWPGLIAVAAIALMIQWALTGLVLHLKYNNLLHFVPPNKHQG